MKRKINNFGNNSTIYYEWSGTTKNFEMKKMEQQAQK